MRGAYSRAKKGKKTKEISPTDEQVNRMKEMRIIIEPRKNTGQDIGQASYTATVQECDEAQADLSRLIQEQSTKKGGKEQDD